MIAKSPAEAKLSDLLSSFEQAILSPLVAGEVGDWTKNVQQETATLSVDYTAYVRTVLHVQYAEIARNAPELSKQLEKLTEEDGIILEEMAKFLEHLHRFSSVIESADPQKRETKLETQRQKLVDLGVALILAIRKHQAASNTWFDEAQLRDIGNAAD